MSQPFRFFPGGTGLRKNYFCATCQSKEGWNPGTICPLCGQGGGIEYGEPPSGHYLVNFNSPYVQNKLKLIKSKNERIKEQKSYSPEENNDEENYIQYETVKKMHWKYFVILGWFIGLCLLCTLLPLFFKNGRKIIAKSFGYW